ncbi:UMP kinase [Patescibacteria group bacterium]|nr:UMP kinase [Patescibacteria group bacterium]MBU1921935.1 UMP kinase [Patescibacteria group bacterium]
MPTKQKIIILSLGGSIIVPPRGIDIKFLKNFKKLILEYVKNGWRFIIIVGGGATCRQYQAAAKSVGRIRPQGLDWLGIEATRLNAGLLKAIFGDSACALVDPNKKIGCKERILIGAGVKPGRSTDYVAVLCAEKYDARFLVNLSNIDFVYDRDPRKYKNAKKIKRIKWPDFKKLVGGAWTPGAHLPFDPIASKLAQCLGLKVVIMNGRKLKEFEKLLRAKPFRGTIIE